jgi:hypothetical protein
MEPLLKNEELRLNFQKMEMMKMMKENDKCAFDINHEFNSKNYIDIKNPLLETITNTDAAENLDIKIDFDNIESKDSKEPSEAYGNLLKNLNFKYTSLFLVSENTDKIVQFLKNVKLEEIKNLVIIRNTYGEKVEKLNLVKTLFSYSNILNNLVNFSLGFFKTIKVDLNYFKKINELKSLKVLKLEEIELSNSFTLNLPRLDTLCLSYCKNIHFDENISLQLNTLYIINSKLCKKKIY